MRHGPGPKNSSRGTVAKASITAREPTLAVKRNSSAYQCRACSIDPTIYNISKPKAARDRLLTNRDVSSTRLNAGAETVSGHAPNLAGRKIFFDRVAESYFAVGINKGHLEEVP
jgi:hypothetical protein